MDCPRISDHALVRFLERAGGLDVELLREALAASLARAHLAAAGIGASNYLIQSDGLLFVVRGDTVTTVLEPQSPARRHAALTRDRAKDQAQDR